MLGVICEVPGIQAGPGRDDPPGPPLGRDELVDDHLPDVGLRVVQAADLPPARMRPDQHFLDHILGEGTVAGQHAGEPQHGGQPRIRELLECHRTSLIGLSDEYTQARERCVVLCVALVRPWRLTLARYVAICADPTGCPTRFSAEDPCSAEEKGSETHTLFPSRIDFPFKSGVRGSAWDH